MGETSTFYRTHTCGELRMEDVGRTVTIAGFFENIREVSIKCTACSRYRFLKRIKLGICFNLTTH